MVLSVTCQWVCSQLFSILSEDIKNKSSQYIFPPGVSSQYHDVQDQALHMEQIVKNKNSELREVYLFNCFILYCVYFNDLHELFSML